MTCIPAIRIGKCLVVLAIIPALLVFSGCGNKTTSMPTGSVKGKVTYNGKTLPSGCKIQFEHKEKSFPATGDIQSDGSYTLLFNGKPDIPEGTYSVTIVAPADAAGPLPNPSDPEAYKKFMEQGANAKPKVMAGQQYFPKKYQNAAESGLTCTVIGGQEAVFDVDMTSGG